MTEGSQVGPVAGGSVIPQRVAVLTNILLRHNVVVLEALQTHVAALRVFLSAITEPDRKNPVNWGSLDAVVQKSLRWTYSFRNKYGYNDVTHLQVPYDTLQLLWSWKPDVLISGQMGGRSVQAAVYKMLRPRTVFIVWATLSQRTEGTRGGVRLALRKWILHRADACFTHGEDSEAYLRSLGFRKPVYHTPYVIESRLTPPVYAPSFGEARSLLYTGQLIERKGIVPFTEVLCRWCHLHPGTRVRFVIGGDGPQRAQLEALAIPANLELVLAGHLTPQVIAEVYAASTFCVFPTLGDEWGMVVHEALQAGVPILASVHAQASLELVREGANGWLFDPEQEEGTLQGLDRAFGTSEDALRRMSENARAAVADWTPEVMGNKMASAVAELTRAQQPSY